MSEDQKKTQKVYVLRHPTLRKMLRIKSRLFQEPVRMHIPYPGISEEMFKKAFGPDKDFQTERVVRRAICRYQGHQWIPAPKPFVGKWCQVCARWESL